jgi:hypothetical protein
MFKQPSLPHFNLALDMQVAPLTERREVPFCAIRFIIVQVVDRKRVAVFRIVWMAATFTLVAARLAESVPELLGPGVRIGADEFSHTLFRYRFRFLWHS